MVSRMMRGLAIIGAGGFGREVVDVVDAINADTGPQIDLLGFAADGHPDPAMLQAWDMPYLGAPDAIAGLDEDSEYVIAIGDPLTRSQVSEKVAGRACRPLVHPSSTSGRHVEIGRGTVICSHVSITSDIRIGDHVHVNLNSTIGHDAVLEDYVTVSPLCAISGNVTLERGVFLGTGVTINPGVTIGAGAVVGSGSVVVKEVPPGVTVVGIPARER